MSIYYNHKPVYWNSPKEKETENLLKIQQQVGIYIEKKFNGVMK